MLDLGALKLSIQVDSGKAKNELGSFGKHAEDFKNKNTNRFKAVKVAFAAIGAATVAVSAAMAKMVVDTINTADAIDKGSQKAHMSAEAYQEWSYALDRCGISQSTLQTGMKKLTDVMTNADKSEVFTKLGVSIKDAGGEFRSQEAVFKDSIMALAQMEDGAERSALANEIFGKSATELAPLLNEGAEGVEELLTKCQELGLVMSEEDVKAGAMLKDSMDDVKASLTMIATKIGVQLMPVVQMVCDFILAHMPEIQAVASKAFSIISAAIEFVKPLLLSLVDPIQNLIAAIKKMVSSASKEGGVFQRIWDDLKLAIEAFFSFVVNVINLITAVIEGDWSAAWEAFKTILLNVLQVVLGLLGAALEAMIALLVAIGSRLASAGKAAFEKLKSALSSVWSSIVSWFSGAVQTIVSKITGIASSVYNAGRNIITSLKNGLVAAWSSVTGWITDKVNWVKNQFSSIGGAISSVVGGSHRNGLRDVPYDGYIAELHKGEMILTAAEADRYEKNQGTTAHNSTNVTVNNYSPKALNEAESARQFRKSARQLQLAF